MDTKHDDRRMDSDSRELFRETAKYYARYRRPYQAKLFDAIIKEFKLDGRGRLLDLGCGTGELTIPLAPYFEEVVGIDSEPGMLDEAKTKTTRKNTNNIRWILKRAEEIESSLGLFRLTTLGVSLQWMGQEIVLQKVYNGTVQGGGVVVIGEASPVWNAQTPQAWQIKRQEIIQKYLGEKRRAGKSFYEEKKKRFEDYLLESPFRDFKEYRFEYDTTRDIDAIIGFLYSTSYASLHLLGDKAPAFEQEMRNELTRIVPSGKFIEQGCTQMLCAQRTF